MAFVSDDVFTTMAIRWEGRITSDRTSHELSRLVKDIDPNLRLVWDNVDSQFWVGKVRVVAGTDLLIPLFPVGDNPLPTELTQEIRGRDLRGRSKEVAKVRYKQIQKQRDDEATERAKTFYPNLGEYSWAIMQRDDEWSRRSLMQDMRAEIRRNR